MVASLSLCVWRKYKLESKSVYWTKPLSDVLWLMKWCGTNDRKSFRKSFTKSLEFVTKHREFRAPRLTNCIFGRSKSSNMQTHMSSVLPSHAPACSDRHTHVLSMSAPEPVMYANCRLLLSSSAGTLFFHRKNVASVTPMVVMLFMQMQTSPFKFVLLRLKTLRCLCTRTDVFRELIQRSNHFAPTSWYRLNNLTFSTGVSRTSKTRCYMLFSRWAGWHGFGWFCKLTFFCSQFCRRDFVNSALLMMIGLETDVFVKVNGQVRTGTKNRALFLFWFAFCMFWTVLRQRADHVRRTPCSFLCLLHFLFWRTAHWIRSASFLHHVTAPRQFCCQKRSTTSDTSSEVSLPTIYSIFHDGPGAVHVQGVQWLQQFVWLYDTLLFCSSFIHHTSSC